MNPGECVNVIVNYRFASGEEFSQGGGLGSPYLPTFFGGTGTVDRYTVYLTESFLPANLNGKCSVVSTECVRFGVRDVPDVCTALPRPGPVPFPSTSCSPTPLGVPLACIDVETPAGYTSSDGVLLNIECEAEGGPWCPFTVAAFIVS